MSYSIFCRVLKKNGKKIPNKARAKKVLIGQFLFYEERKRKLKLGRLIFEFQMVKHNGIYLGFEVVTRNVGIDNTAETERRLDVIMERQGWHGDAKNIVCLSLLITIALIYIYYEAKYLYYTYLPRLAYRAPHYDYIIQTSLDEILVNNIIEEFAKYEFINFELATMIGDFCAFFAVLF